MLSQKETTYNHLNLIDYASLDNWSSSFLLNREIFYNKKYTLVKIGAFLKRNRTQVKILDEIWYRRPTIQMNAKGIKVRDEVLGKHIGTKNQFKVSKGQFLLSKIDARNGAFGVVPNDLDGCIITGNFWTFDVDYSLINPFYLSLLAGTTQFQMLCQNASVGTTNRNYLQQDLFLNFEIPLPELVVQNQLVKDYEKGIAQSGDCLAKVKTIEEDKEKYLNEFFGIKESIIKPRKSFSFIDFKDLKRWGVSFAAYQSRWKIQPKYMQSKIGSICRIGSGGTPDKNSPKYYNGGIPWVKTTEVVNNIITTTEDTLSPEGLKNSSAKIYPIGSLIIAMYGQGLTRGRTAKLGIDAATNQACAVLFDIDEDIILTDYLWLYLINEYHRLRELASGNNQPNLNAGMIYDYVIQIPPIAIQKQLIKVVSGFNKDIIKLRSDAKRKKEESLNEFAKSVFS